MTRTIRMDNIGSIGSEKVIKPRVFHESHYNFPPSWYTFSLMMESVVN